MNFEGISVIMPTFNQAAFISRAIESLVLQSFKNWELIIINDGSRDYTEELVSHLSLQDNIVLIKNVVNEGLGVSINKGLVKAKYDLIAYLPSDDIYYSNHLQTLYQQLISDNNSVLAFAGLKYDYKDLTNRTEESYSLDLNGEYPLQLVQVLHKRTIEIWTERNELVTDDINRLYWNKLKPYGEFLPTKNVSCEWIAHPFQRHRFINEGKGGNIYRYKNYYHVNYPIRYQSTFGNYIDESETYKLFRKKPIVKNGSTRILKILIVGELAYNPERICALEERGHKLYGLWISNPSVVNTVGPLPFGNVEDIPFKNWVERVKEIKPDIIYALLNFHAVTLAHHVMLSNLDVPFVWHFKEGPFICRQNGVWKELKELYEYSDGQIYTNKEVKNWFGQFLSQEDECAYILDGDLPKKERFQGVKSSLLSKLDGQIHTVIPGRPFGLKTTHIKELAKYDINLHFYGNIYHSGWTKWIETAKEVAPGFLHIHPNCSSDNWVTEFSKYDAGWLHYFDSSNNGELMRASWADLNYPARLATLAAAGVPMIQKDNSNHLVATQSLIKNLEMGVFFENFEDLGEKLCNREFIDQIRLNVLEKRMFFCFDYHVDDLISFFYRVISKKQSKISN